MNPFFRNVIRINPQIIDSIPKRFLNRSDIELALSLGYEVTEKTPSHLLQYHSIASSFLQVNASAIETGNRVLSFEELTYLLPINNINDKIISDSYINLSNYTSAEQSQIVALLKDNIEIVAEKSYKCEKILEHSADLAIALLDRNVNLYGELAKYIKDYEIIYSVVSSHQDTFEFEKMNKELLLTWFNHDKSIILRKDIFGVIDSEEYLECVKNSGYSRDEFLDESQTFPNFIVALHFISEDFSNVQYAPEKANYKDQEKLKKLFLDNIPSSLNYLEKVSNIIEFYGITTVERQQIIDAIIENKTTFNNCQWQFIESIHDIVYNNLLNNPQSLITWEKYIFQGFTEEEEQNIANLITEGKIKITDYIQAFRQSQIIFDAALQVNPFIIDNNSAFDYMYFSIDSLMENGYKISLQTPINLVYKKESRPYFLEALKKDISLLNHPGFPSNNETDEEIEELYSILKSHNYLLTKESHPSLFNNPLLLIDALEAKTIELNDISEFRNLETLKTTQEFYNYLLAHYPLNEIPIAFYIENRELYSNCTALDEKIYLDLNNNFANCLNYSASIKVSDDFQKKIYELYLKNYAANSAYYDESAFLQNNHYINYYECITNDKPLLNIKNMSISDAREFIKQFQTLDITFRPEYINIFIENGAPDIILEHPEAIDSITSLYRNEDRAKKLILECLENGTYHLSYKTPDVITSRIMEDCIKRNIPGIGYLFKSIPYYREKEILNRLKQLIKERKIDVSIITSETIRKFDNDEFYEMALANPQILSRSSEHNKHYKQFRNDPRIRELIKKNNEQEYDSSKEYSNEELKAFGNDNITLYLEKSFVKNIKLTSEEWGKVHELLIQNYHSEPNDFIRYKVKKADLTYLIKKDENTYDLQILDEIFAEDLYLTCQCIQHPLPSQYIEQFKAIFQDKNDETQQYMLHYVPFSLAKSLVTDYFSLERKIKLYDVFSPDEVYEMWKQLNPEINDETYIPRNKQVILDILKKDISAARYVKYNYPKYYPSASENPNNQTTDYDEMAFIDEIYDIFKSSSQDINIFECPIFFRNPRIYQECITDSNYISTHFILKPISFEFFESQPEEIQKQLAAISLRNSPNSIIDLNAELSNAEIIELLESQPIVITKEICQQFGNQKIFHYLLDNYYDQIAPFLDDEILSRFNPDRIKEIGLKNKVILTENSPIQFKLDKDIAMQSFALNPSSIVYADYSLEFTPLEQETITNTLLASHIYFYPNAFSFLRDNKDYLIASAQNKPECIDYLSIYKLNMVDINKLIGIAKEHLKNNNYALSPATPHWLLYDPDIRKQYLEQYPESANRFTDYVYLDDNNISHPYNPITVIKSLIDDISLIDKIPLNPNYIYPKDQLDTLVEKLIANKYVVNPNTPAVLLNNDKIVYYALKNNYKIPEKYIEDFITFENIYKLQDNALFQKYIEQGYGKKYTAYYEKLGIATTITAASLYGHLLSREKLSLIDSIDDIRENIILHIKKGECETNLLEYLVRSEYELTDNELSNGLGTNRYYSSKLRISNKDEVFRYILKKNPDKIKFYTGNNDDIYKLAISSGYQLTQAEYNNNLYFRNSVSIAKQSLALNLENIYLYEGADDTLYEYAINDLHYNLDYSKIENNPRMCQSPTIIKKGMEDNIDYAYMYTGDAKDIQDLFTIKDKNNRQIIPSPENIAKLKYIYANDNLMLQAVSYDPSNILYYQGKNENIYKAAVEGGFVPTSEYLQNNEYLRKSSSIIRAAMHENINSVIYYQGSILYIEDVFEFQDKNGHRFIATPELIKEFDVIHYNDELMKKAILQNADNIVYYTGTTSELFDLALAKGYVPKTPDFEYSNSLRNVNVIHEYIINNQLEDLIPILIYYSGTDDALINKIYHLLLKDKYSEIIPTPNDAKNYASIWKSFNDQIDHQNLISYMNTDNIKAFQNMKIDYYLVLKYGLKNDKMSEYIKIIESHQTDTFSNFYNNVTDNYLEYNNNAFGVDLFLKLARFFNHYPELVKDVMSNRLTDVEIANLVKVINSNCPYNNVTSVADLNNLDAILKSEIDATLNKELITPNELKDAILKYVFDIEYPEFVHILENYINFDTLDQIVAKCQDKSSELYIEASILRAMFAMLEETINATNDIDALKSLLKSYLENQELVDKTRTLFYDIKERIRNIYELDANNTLTDLENPNLTRRKATSNPNVEIIELENSEYVIYAHVTSNSNYEEYVNYRFNGKVTICVSPISNIGKKLYSDSGVILGFTNVPRGGFIGSSNRNMGSNSYINENDYEVRDDHYYHLEIRDSSSLTPAHHPETLLYRDGLLPSCIIIRDKEPSAAEIDAQRVLSEAIREKLNLDADYLIPLVHTQAIGNVADLKQKNDISIIEGEQEKVENEYIDASVDLGEYQVRLERLNEIRRGILKIRETIDNLQISRSPVYDIIRMKIGGSHDMYKCHLTDREGVYYLKPGYRKDGGSIDPYRSYAMETAYKIQSLVNPENAVFSKTVEVPSSSLGRTEPGNILCSVIEVKPNTTSYEGWSSQSIYQPLSEKEMTFFLREFISDYLLFSYDTKAENFIKDKDGNAYGIDKEQALKFILDSEFIKRDGNGQIETIDTSIEKSMTFDPNSCGIIYKRIFYNVELGNQDISESAYNYALASLDVIDSMSDEDYKEIFRNYVEDFSTSSIVDNIKNKYMDAGYTETEAIGLVKEELYTSLLARKNNLKKEFITYFSKVISNHYKNQGKEEPEWLIKTTSLNI